MSASGCDSDGVASVEPGVSYSVQWARPVTTGGRVCLDSARFEDDTMEQSLRLRLLARPWYDSALGHPPVGVILQHPDKALDHCDICAKPAICTAFSRNSIYALRAELFTWFCDDCYANVCSIIGY